MIPIPLTPKYEVLLSSIETRRHASLIPVVGLLSVAERWTRSCQSRLAEAGLSDGRFAALLVLDAYGDSGPADLAEAIGVTRGAMTTILDGLAAESLAIRIADRSDRRRMRVAITTAGRRRLRAALARQATWLTELGQVLTAREKRALTNIATKLMQHSDGID